MVYETKGRFTHISAVSVPCQFSVSDVTDTESQNTVLNRTCVNASAEFKVTIFFSTDTEALGGHGTDTALICVNRPLI